MLYDSIKIGDRAEIYMVKEKSVNEKSVKEKSSGMVYYSQVEDILSDTDVLLHVPISYGQLVKLSMEGKYNVVFFTNKGMLTYEAEIKEFKKDNGLDFMAVALLSEGERVQRREFTRFTCLLPLKFTSVNETSFSRDHMNYLDGVIKDIGCGGLRYVTNESLEERDRIKSVVMLDDELLVLNGKILSKTYFPKSNFKYQYRVEFFGVTQEERDKITLYILNEERKLEKRQRP